MINKNSFSSMNINNVSNESTSEQSINPSLTHAQLSKTNQYYLYNKSLLSRHQRAIPPKEAFLFFPTHSDEIIENPKKPEKTLRMIFANVTFLEYENRKLSELNERIKQINMKNPLNKIIFPSWWIESDSRRFLQATSFNLDKTIEYISKQIQWKTTFFPFQITDNVIHILNSGFMYVCGRDCHYRPVLIIHARSFFEIKDKYNYNEIFMAIIFFLEYVINNMLIIGQVENWIMITDITKVSLLFMPSDLKRIVTALSSTYRCRLFRNYIIGMNAALRFLAKIFMSFLDPVTVSKNRFLDDSNRIRELTTFIHPRNIEEKYGGKAHNILPGLHAFFPPVMPSMDFSKEGEVLVISEEEYKRRCYSKSNKPFVISKEFLSKWEEQRRVQEEELKQLKDRENMQQTARLKSVKTVIKSPIDVLTDNKVYGDYEGMSNKSKNGGDNKNNYNHSSNNNNTFYTNCSNKSSCNIFIINNENVRRYFKQKKLKRVFYFNTKSTTNLLKHKSDSLSLSKHHHNQRTVSKLIGMSRINCTSPIIKHNSNVNSNK